MKVNAVLWYLSGMSMHRIAFLHRVSAQAVLTWIRDCATDSYEKPEPTDRTMVLELDKMWHYLKTKRCKLWIWKPWIATRGSCSAGNVGGGTRRL